LLPGEPTQHEQQTSQQLTSQQLISQQLTSQQLTSAYHSADIPNMANTKAKSKVRRGKGKKSTNEDLIPKFPNVAYTTVKSKDKISKVLIPKFPFVSSHPDHIPNKKSDDGNKMCFYCGIPGHGRSRCPTLRGDIARIGYDFQASHPKRGDMISNRERKKIKKVTAIPTITTLT